MNKKIICKHCNGTGIVQIYKSEALGRSCEVCDGRGFYDLSVDDDTKITLDYEFKEKKHIDGIDNVLLMYIPPLSSMCDSRPHGHNLTPIGKMSYKDFYEDNFTEDTVSFFPVAKEHFCPAELEHFLPKKECSDDILCSCDKKLSAKNCPFFDFQKNEKVLSYCWKHYECQDSSYSIDISLTSEEVKLLAFLLNHLLDYPWQQLGETQEILASIYLRLILKLKSEVNWEILNTYFDLPEKDPVKYEAWWRENEKRITQESFEEARKWREKEHILESSNESYKSSLRSLVGYLSAMYILNR